MTNPTAAPKSRYLSCAETAKLVRSALKAAFPGITFSVRSETYSMGASITVSWTDGPTERQVNDVTDRYRRSDFDGSDDSTKNRPDTLIAFDADFISGSRTLSPTFVQLLTDDLDQAPEGEYGDDEMAYRVRRYSQGVSVTGDREVRRVPA
jgi:hypothetical protein